MSPVEAAGNSRLNADPFGTNPRMEVVCAVVMERAAHCGGCLVSSAKRMFASCSVWPRQLVPAGFGPTVWMPETPPVPKPNPSSITTMNRSPVLKGRASSLYEPVFVVASHALSGIS